MAKRKIIFFAIVGFILVALTLGILWVTQLQKKNIISADDLNIWITQGTTADYEELATDFQKKYPEYKNVNIRFEKKAADKPDQYRTFILSALSEKAGPDIFMIAAGEDTILEEKIALIPEDSININAFEDTFDPVFQELIVSTGDFINPDKKLKGIPIGYETLGVFYNNSLLRSGVPKTWPQIEKLYGTFPPNTFPTNLGLGPIFTPNIGDILAGFFIQNNIESYKNVSEGQNIFNQYQAFASLWNNNTNTDESEDFYSTQTNLEGTVSALEKSQMTTLDAFLEGKIGMIVGYPSLVRELEKSAKRIGGNNSASLIQTAQFPSKTSRESANVAKYSYFAIAETTNKPNVALAFLQYVASEDAQRVLMKNFPHLLPAHKSFLEAKLGTRLSPIIKNAKIDGFIPSPWQKISLFDYGIRSEFNQIIKDGFMSKSEIKRNAMAKKISEKIACIIDVQINQSNSVCE